MNFFLGCVCIELNAWDYFSVYVFLHAMQFGGEQRIRILFSLALIVGISTNRWKEGGMRKLFHFPMKIKNKNE